MNQLTEIVVYPASRFLASQNIWAASRNIYYAMLVRYKECNKIFSCQRNCLLSWSNKKTIHNFM